MIGMLKGINGAKGISLNIKSIRVIIGGNVNAFRDKFKRKKIYFRKIFWVLVGH